MPEWIGDEHDVTCSGWRVDVDTARLRLASTWTRTLAETQRKRGPMSPTMFAIEQGCDCLRCARRRGALS